MVEEQTEDEQNKTDKETSTMTNPAPVVYKKKLGSFPFAVCVPL